MDTTTPRGPRLRLVCINDVYLLIHLPRIRSMLDALQERHPVDRVLLTLAGDFVAPSLLSSIDAGRGMIDCLNALGVTHVTFGNHEDDILPQELSARAREFRGVWLATNVDGFSPELPRNDVVTVTGPSGRSVRVGLLGVVIEDPTLYRKVPFGASAVRPALTAAIEETNKLFQEQRCDVVLPLTHQTIASDRMLARTQRSPPYPVIIGGHEHEVMIEELTGTWIIKAGSDAKHAIVIDLEWQGTTSEEQHEPTVRVHLEDADRYPLNEALQSKVEEHLALVRQLEQATLLTIEPGKPLSSVGTRKQQTSLGALLCTLVREVLRAEGCLLNGGAIRASATYEERFTYGNLKAEVPFDNELVVVPMPGRVLRSIIAASRSKAPQETGGFLQADDGLTIRSDTHELTHVAGAPLDLEREYQIVVVRDMLLGLDRVAPLIEFAQKNPERVPPSGSGQTLKVVLVNAFARALWNRLGGFARIDSKGDGFVDAEELSQAIATVTHQAPSPVTTNLVLRLLDANKDGVVSASEAAALDSEKK